MRENTFHQINRDVILNRAKDYYENNKEVLKEQTKNNTRIYQTNKEI